jgi:hypothetical protein
MMINFHSMEYYFLWCLSQYSGSLEAGPYVVCFLAEARDLVSIQNIRAALGTSGLLFSGCCGSFPCTESSDHELDHLCVLFAEVTDECRCNCGCGKCLHGVYRDSFTFDLEEWLHYLHGRNSVWWKMSAVWSDGTMCHPTVLCCVKTECCYLMISIKHGSFETSVHVGFRSV